MNFYFLDKADLFFILGFTSLVTFFIPYLGIIFLVFIIVVLFMLRVKKFKKLSSNNNECFSPVNGKVLEVSTTTKSQIVEINISKLGDWGIYSPIKSKVSSLGIGEEKSEKNFLKLNYSKSNIIEVENSSGKVSMDFKEREFSLSEIYLNVDVGDLVQVGSVLGYRMFGGKLIMSLPLNFALKVKKGDNLYARTTLIGEQR